MSSEEEAFAQAMAALRPYLSNLVVVGGWAHRLFRLSPSATKPNFPALMTDDADVAMPANLRQGVKSIDALLKDAGFDEVLRGDERPPVAYYVQQRPNLEFELEFITNKTGGPVRRDGTRDVTVTLAGAVAQKLPYVDSLLIAPWTVELNAQVGFEVPGGPAEVRIANPASYLFQKLVVLPARTASGKGAKDMLYIFDTFQLLSSALDDLAVSWKSLMATRPESDRAKIQDLEQGYFGSSASDAIVAAAQLAKSTGRPSPPSAALIAATCRVGFSRLWRP